jgi:predicted DNA-binding ArsR family transcriptional regulator
MLRWKVVFDTATSIVILLILSSTWVAIVEIKAQPQPQLISRLDDVSLNSHKNIKNNSTGWMIMNQATSPMSNAHVDATSEDINEKLSQLRQAVLLLCNDDEQQSPQIQQVCQELLQDTAQLQRILVARQEDVQKSADLVLEQARFKVKWDPRHITPNMITNALPCT